jgi:L-amino acid N-acyltransferase YncA
MLGLVDRLSKPGHAGFMNGTQATQDADLPAVAIRPVRPADLAALSGFFAGLSAQTRYLRFFAPVTPNRALLRLLSGGAGTVNALVAVACGGIVGHAMAADQTTPQGAPTTDIGVVVTDAWQDRGVGSALVGALITGAQARGVTSVTMDVLPGNRRVLAMITGRWPAARIDHSRDSDTVYLRLPQHQQQRAPARPAGRPALPVPRPALPGPTSRCIRCHFSPRAAASPAVTGSAGFRWSICASRRLLGAIAPNTLRIAKTFQDL